jgi:2-keto-4-pentenoate hydratase/2-oxohepta-3-ene-1,7-dioic acid hydratase in catechol pathway
MINHAFREDWHARYGRSEPKVICVALNYRTHAGESGFEIPKAPLLFAKFANTLCRDGDPVLVPAGIGHLDAEVELGVVIGRTASRVPETEAEEVIDGYTCANDLSAREIQFGDGQWFRGKGLDGFCPIGPRVVPAGELDPSNLRVLQRLNGETLQDSRTSDLIFTVPTLVSYISHALTLERGDIILTGTPEGVGVFREPKLTLRDGDVVEVEIEGIGTLRNEIRIEA